MSSAWDIGETVSQAASSGSTTGAKYIGGGTISATRGNPNVNNLNNLIMPLSILAGAMVLFFALRGRR